MWHKGSLGVRMMPELCAEKARDATLDDEKYDCVIVKALGT